MSDPLREFYLLAKEVVEAEWAETHALRDYNAAKARADNARARRDRKFNEYVNTRMKEVQP